MNSKHNHKPNDPINPSHYKTSGVECIEIAELFPYTLGNAIKYAWRAGLKDDLQQDLKKCSWYLNRAMANCDEFLPTKTLELAKRKFANADKDEFDNYPLQYAILKFLVAGLTEQAKDYLLQAMEQLQAKNE